MQQDRFYNKNILVVGSASGIGKAVAKRIAAEGGNLGLIDLNIFDLSLLAEELKDFGRKVEFRRCDVTNYEEVETSINQLADALGGLHGLSHNAAIMRLYHTHEMTMPQWQQIIDVNLTGTFIVNKAAIPHLLKNQESYIVNTSSTTISLPHPWLAAYSASKGGISSFTKSIALEYHLQGLRANCVLPDGFSSPLAKSFASQIPHHADLRLTQVLQPISKDKLADPQDIAGVISMLLSTDARCITAAEISVDNGKF